MADAKHHSSVSGGGCRSVGMQQGSKLGAGLLVQGAEFGAGLLLAADWSPPDSQLAGLLRLGAR